MSALARYFNHRGAIVCGYDKTETTLTKQLEEEGIRVHFDESTAKIPKDVDLVIYTPAVPKSHVAYAHCASNGIPMKKRAEVLGMISKSQRCIAVAGTHGKTSTTSILTHLLRTGGVDCTAFLGGIATNYGTNYIQGNSDWVVVEADEYDRSFLHLEPEMAVVLSMDADHLDIYGDEKTMLETGFKAFLRNVKKNGTIFLKDELAQLFDNQSFETFGVNGGDYQAINIRVENGGFAFYLQEANTANALTKVTANWWMPLPGRHNIENALAAIGIALKLGISHEQLKEGLRTFEGIQRRFEFIIREPDCVFISDYAHHPTELTAAIGAAKEPGCAQGSFRSQCLDRR